MFLGHQICPVHRYNRLNKNSLGPSYHLGYAGEGPLPTSALPTLCLTPPCHCSKTLEALPQSERHFLAQNTSKSQLKPFLTTTWITSQQHQAEAPRGSHIQEESSPHHLPTGHPEHQRPSKQASQPPKETCPLTILVPRYVQLFMTERRVNKESNLSYGLSSRFATLAFLLNFQTSSLWPV